MEGDLRLVLKKIDDRFLFYLRGIINQEIKERIKKEEKEDNEQE